MKEVELPLRVAINNNEDVYNMIILTDGEQYYEILDVRSDKESILHLFTNEYLEEIFWTQEYFVQQIYKHEQDN
jgi:hypothetical protein